MHALVVCKGHLVDLNQLLRPPDPWTHNDVKFFIHFNRLSKKVAGNKMTVVHRQGAHFGQFLRKVPYISAVALGTCATLLVQQGEAFTET